ncbi:MAG TPA: transglycosylase SLT domain-containing protein [Ktedonobacteraceae bacterium]|nr:transglycosylase SLT domain-containing protein [Ktedonobacteraceae bacterium]
MISHRLRTLTTMPKVILALTTAFVLLGALCTTCFLLPTVNAHPLGANSACSWYTVRRDDTLLRIANRHHTTTSLLIKANHIWNANFIIEGSSLCIPHRISQRHGNCGNGLHANGGVCWYAYSSLEYSSREQVAVQLRRAASRNGVPANLLLAVAWQESGWHQHIIAHDGGIGVMQLMPYTATSLNRVARARMNPYKLHDNVDLGAFYLHGLWCHFHGNVPRIVSAYNEGSWNVDHRGIFNRSYVRNVMALMYRM